MVGNLSRQVRRRCRAPSSRRSGTRSARGICRRTAAPWPPRRRRLQTGLDSASSASRRRTRTARPRNRTPRRPRSPVRRCPACRPCRRCCRPAGRSRSAPPAHAPRSRHPATALRLQNRPTAGTDRPGRSQTAPRAAAGHLLFRSTSICGLRLFHSGFLAAARKIGSALLQAKPGHPLPVARALGVHHRPGDEIDMGLRGATSGVRVAGHHGVVNRHVLFQQFLARGPADCRPWRGCRTRLPPAACSTSAVCAAG